MIQNIRIDYLGDNENIDIQRLSEFVEQLQDLLIGIADELNEQQSTLVIKVYDGRRMTYSFENIAPVTALKAIALSRP